jgi:ribosomal protein L11 methyltransferase
MAWLQVRVASEYPEFVEEILLALGAQAISMVDAEDDPVLEPGPGETPLWTHTVTIGLFHEHAELTPITEALRTQLPDGETVEIQQELVEDQDWVRIWLKDCPPLKFGTRLWVCPREKAVYEDGAVTLLLDPGLAFGTGTHPSTALCLDWLAHHEIGGKRVLDFGCGSGILAIAALKLGAGSALCTDIDPQAITATNDNARDNGVAAALSTVPAETAFTPSLQPAPAELILANILAQPLIQLAPLLAASCAEGAQIVLAGLLDRQAEEVRAAYLPWFSFDADLSREGWTRLAARRSAAPAPEPG